MLLVLLPAAWVQVNDPVHPLDLLAAELDDGLWPGRGTKRSADECLQVRR